MGNQGFLRPAFGRAFFRACGCGCAAQVGDGPVCSVGCGVPRFCRGTYTADPMLWVKAFHIVFVASWFAGLFYLPRIYVNLAMVPPGSVAERERLLLMSRKLLRFTTLLAVPAVGLGLWLWLQWWWGATGWLHAKLVLVLVTIGYHWVCARMLRRIEAGQSMRSHVWYRWFNELPVLLLTVVVILVVVKPF